MKDLSSEDGNLTHPSEIPPLHRKLGLPLSTPNKYLTSHPIWGEVTTAAEQLSSLPSYFLLSQQLEHLTVIEIIQSERESQVYDAGTNENYSGMW